MRGADAPNGFSHLATARASDVGDMEGIGQVRLQQQRDAFKAGFAGAAPVGRLARYETKIDELRANSVREAAIRV
jgi:hypothetical protein